MSTGELASTTMESSSLYALLSAARPEKIETLVKVANVKIDSYWPSLFSKLFEKRSMEDLILNVGSGGVPVAVAAAAGGGGAAPAGAVEEKKEEPKEKSDDDMGFSLFD